MAALPPPRALSRARGSRVAGARLTPVSLSAGPALAAGATLTLLWLIFDPRTADLAAAVYRSHLFAREGFTLWDNAWFGGHTLPGYSLIFPALGALIGPRTVGAIAVLASVTLFAHLARRHAPEHARAASVWFAVGAAGDLFIGRLTFALGVMLALATVTAWSHGRLKLSIVLAVGTAAASPVAGLFLALVAVAAVSELGWRQAASIGGAALLTAGAMAVVFPDGGTQPYDLAAALAALGVSGAAAACINPAFRAVRRGALLYVAAIALAYVVPSPMGSNVARLGVLFAGPLLLCAATYARRALLVATCTVIVVWQVWGPATEVVKAVTSPATAPAYFAPLRHFLAGAGAGNARVEVVPTTTRWESVYVARDFALARGWETQVDRRYNSLFYQRRLDPSLYRRWLVRNGVRFVALADAPLERWGRLEGQIVAGHHRWLRPVWRNAHWQVFAVRRPARILSGPGRLEVLGSSGFALQASHAGSLTVRVHYTPYWTTTGPACTLRGAHGWTTVRARRPGRIRVVASWSLGGLLDTSTCGAPAAN